MALRIGGEELGIEWVGGSLIGFVLGVGVWVLSKSIQGGLPSIHLLIFAIP